MDHHFKIKNDNRTKIVGILLVRNEDLYLERIIANISDFCDEILIADHKSTDRTPEIARSLQKRFAKIQYTLIDHPAESHQLIAGYADTPTWIFAVDGDEIYDRSGLIALRRQILAGEYAENWMILGNVLHCVELNQREEYALGYLTPPCRSMTKLYNFARIRSWDGPCPERLHGGTISFNPGYSNGNRLMLYEKIEWDDSLFRCLHLCFLPRSSKEKSKMGRLVERQNISDKNSRFFLNKILALLSRLVGRSKGSQYKREKYMRGPLVKKETSLFLG